MAITFADETAAPSKPKENEFRDVITALAAAGPTAVKSYVVAGKTLEESTAQAESDKRRMASAAKELLKKNEKGEDVSDARTVKTRFETLADGKSIKVYFWVMGKKITRTRKPAETPAN